MPSLTIEYQYLTISQWGLYTALIGGAAYFYSPIYRGLTIQFKVYVSSLPVLSTYLYHLFFSLSYPPHLSFLQMSGMIAGGVVEADRTLRAHEAFMRHNNRLKREAAVWRAYEADFERRGTPGVGSEAGSHGTQKDEGALKHSEQVEGKGK